MRGRKPKTASQKQADGDTCKVGAKKLAAQIEAEASVKVTRGLPQCPRHLRGRARAAWNLWAEELVLMKHDNRPDAMMLEGACVGYERAVDADLIIAKDGLIIEESIVDEETGEKVVMKRKAHPAIAISRAMWNQVRSFCSEFGLSPVSRTRLTVEKKDDGDTDMMAILSMPRAARTTTATLH